MSTLTEWDELSLEAQRDRREGKRVPLTFPIEVSGFDHTAHMFSERTKTTDISELGCRFQVKTEIARGDVVAIRLLSRCRDGVPGSKPLLFQIVWVQPDPEGEGWIAGALKLQPENIWHVAFPPTNQPKPQTA
jgi:hypothetical protein